MTKQIPDLVHYDGRAYAITAVDGTGLFDLAEHGLTVGPLSSACWRGHICEYELVDRTLILRRVEIGTDPDESIPAVLYDVAATVAGPETWHTGALIYEPLTAPADSPAGY